ncbi:MAG: cytochrome b/b6 domain-containing protein [Acidobacteria bacterium]|nr:cytochrome b/b6 domain-containing protein [Acidobacteriota bacterium]MBI3487393.1 cytochrome b/b6 domain-containing protein [Acidobacteriota bacterium]
MSRIVLYPLFNRIWHWTQALLILLLALTGFEVRGTFRLFGYLRAVNLHHTFAVALVVLILFAIFWHVTTGEWRQYIPTRAFLREMVAFYLTGIFKNAPHPVRKERTAKLNPLQRLAYLGFKVLIIPVQVSTGALYFFYPNLSASGWPPSSLWFIAVLHVLGAFGLLAFLVGHVYLTTTGHRPLSNLKAMLVGYEEVHEEAAASASEEPSA